LKALILAGGHGMRLRPASSAVNKHLLPVYDKPMVMYGIEALREAGIEDIYVSISTFNPFGFMDLLRDGKELSVHLSFIVQGEVKGIAWAVNEAEPWLRGEPFIVYLGDNIFTRSLKPYVERFKQNPGKPMVLLKDVSLEEASRYGVARFKGLGPSADLRSLGYIPEIVEFVEKPPQPPSHYIVLGLYFLTPRFFNVFSHLKPSKRGEYEVTDVLNLLLPVEAEAYGLWDREAVWWDCGTFEDILMAGNYMREARR